MSAEPAWTIKRILGVTKDWFTERGLDSPRLDAELLLADVLDVDRIILYTQFDKPLSDDELARYRSLVKRRGNYEPVAYILGEREFYGRAFAVSSAVLVPRPETEHIIEVVLEWAARECIAAPSILDIGTGSGNIAISLACELPQASVMATDISAAALQVARTNAERHGVLDRVEFFEGDLLAPVAGREFDIVVSNPPYVEDEVRAELMPDVRDHEPGLALFAGPKGYDVLDRLCAEVGRYMAAPGLFACEIGAGQHEHVQASLEDAGGWASVGAVRDLAGHQRIVVGTR